MTYLEKSISRISLLCVSFWLIVHLSALAFAATDNTTYTYDQARAGYHNVGQLTSVSNKHAIIHYDYNSHGQLVRERYVIDGQTYTRTFTYDAGDRLRFRQFSDGEIWPLAGGEYQYDAAGRLSAIPGAIIQIQYAPHGEATQISFANGTQTINSYDPQRHWLTGTNLRKAAQVLFEEEYIRDDVGRITKVRSNQSNGDWDYTYDSINQLIQATNVGNSDLSQSFSYSPSGNLLSKTDVGTYTYPPLGAARPHAPTQVGAWTFKYDANGNMIAGKGRQISYDGKDRPVTVIMGNVVTQYVYGPDDKRLKKISGGKTTLYLGDDEEILPDGTAIKHLDGAVRRVGGTTNWLHRDHLASVRMLTNTSGNIASISRYQPYGKRTDVQQAADTPRESKGWIGERDDLETGLTYLNARYYDPELARFIQADWLSPINPGVGTNRYAYAGNNPVFWKDPSGNQYIPGPAAPWYNTTPTSSYIEQVGAGFLNIVPNTINIVNNTFYIAGEYTAPFSGTLENFALTTPFTHDDLMAGAVSIYGELAILNASARFRNATALSQLNLSDNLANKVLLTSERGVDAMVRGRASEARVLDEFGLSKNTQRVSTQEGFSIPDALTNTISLEVKDTKNVSLSKQLRIQTNAAKDTGRTSVLVTGEKTCISKPCLAAYDQVIRRKDLGPR